VFIGKRPAAAKPCLYAFVLEPQFIGVPETGQAPSLRNIFPPAETKKPGWGRVFANRILLAFDG